MSLYLEHFGLREPPFRITPHTDFFFSGANRGPTLDALIYAITQDEGIVKVTGEVGSGKTMLCRMLLERLPANVETLYLANPSLSRQEILGAIADELGVPTDGKATHSLTRALQDALIERYAAGKRVVMLIDEAHAMPAESLEEIRLLSNLESKANKLLQIALFAQPELDERLSANDMRQLRERITQHFNLAPLKQDDVASYIEFRLRAAGYHGPNPFTDAAVKQIANLSEGLSRRINILADKSLLAAYSSGSHQVDSAEIRIAAHDARFTPLRQPAPFKAKQLLLGIVGSGVVALLLLGAFNLGSLSGQPAPAISEKPRPALESATDKPVAKTFPPLRPVASSNAEAPANIRFGQLTRQHFAQYDSWIESAPRQHYFIQLLATEASHTGEIEGFLARAAQVLDPAELRAYRSSLSGNDRVGVIYGDYPTREAAAAAMLALPESIKAAQPFPRQVSRLH
ncbi:ExeA family protein [Dechloromonas sp. A34]|uniref:ExeA family protein n=1 Tax=Dechloromonas sp. A34 TaxID=447588 RepID=UPI002248CEB3|nr:AAA family ATPase [Dechloromonas sp. A34]